MLWKESSSQQISPRLQLQTTVFPKDHDVVLTSLGNLAFAKTKNAEFKKALQVRTVRSTLVARFASIVSSPRICLCADLQQYFTISNFKVRCGEWRSNRNYRIDGNHTLAALRSRRSTEMPYYSSNVAEIPFETIESGSAKNKGVDPKDCRSCSR